VGERRFDRARLVDEAIARVGEDDFGEPGWEEGLDLLLDSLNEEARLNDLGVEIARADVTGYLSNRLSINAWRRDHPEVALGTIERPIIIVGQPRTGTTILYDLLAQDPDLRAPLTWEVDRPVPPPQT
jgi:sulfotransferase family protein